MKTSWSIASMLNMIPSTALTWIAEGELISRKAGVSDGWRLDELEVEGTKDSDGDSDRVWVVGASDS